MVTKSKSCERGRVRGEAWDGGAGTSHVELESKGIRGNKAGYRMRKKNSCLWLAHSGWHRKGGRTRNNAARWDVGFKPGLSLGKGETSACRSVGDLNSRKKGGRAANKLKIIVSGWMSSKWRSIRNRRRGGESESRSQTREENIEKLHNNGSHIPASVQSRGRTLTK